MPIFICNGCKSTPNKVLKYVLDKKKATLVRTINLDDGRSYAQQFYETALVWDKPTGYDTRKYYHAKLSFDIRDNAEYGGALTPMLAMRIANRLARELWMSHEAVMAAHTDKAHIHVHIIINAVSLETGKMLHINDAEYRKQKDRANTLAAEYGLSAIDWREATQKRRQAEKDGSTKFSKTVAEQRIRNRGGEVWKDALREIIDTAKESTDNSEDFIKLLAEQGVNLSRSTSKTISYVFGEHPAVRGNRLGEKYTAEAIRAALMANREGVQKQHSGLDTLIDSAEQKKSKPIATNGRSTEKSR